MITMFGDHAAFIIPAYVVSALVIISLALWLRLQYTVRQKELRMLDQSGIKRRSAGGADSGRASGVSQS
jgi:heme exporter protein CcmD